MKPRIFILIICFFLKQFAFSQTYSNLISDKEIYEFLKYVVKNDPRVNVKLIQLSRETRDWRQWNFIRPDSIEERIRYDDLYLFKDKNGLDTLFSVEDKNFLFQQVASIKDSIWHNNIGKLKRRKGNHKPTVSFSIPIFSIDRRFLLLSKGFSETFSGDGGYYIYYKNASGNWEFLRSINTYIWII